MRFAIFSSMGNTTWNDVATLWRHSEETDWAAACVTDVPRVFLKEQFGSPEAVWEMHVKDFPAVVTMDSHGNSLHADVESESLKNLAAVGAAH